MQTSPEQLESRLQTDLPPAIWIAGDEPLLLQENCDLVRQSAREQGFTEREVINAGSDFVWHNLLQSANSLSLFAERKLIDLRLPSVKLDNKAKEVLQQFVDMGAADTLLLISSPRVEKATQNTKWFKGIEGPSLFVPVWPVKADALPAWIMQRLQRHNLSADRDAVQLLAERVEGNLLAAAQEVEKLAIVSDGKHLDLDTVMQSVADSSRFDAFGLIDACLQGNAARGLKILSHLQAEGSEALMILNLLCAEVRKLARMAQQVEQGQNINGVMQSNRIWNNRKNMISSTLQRHNSQHFNAFLRRALIVDKAVKGEAPNNPWDELSSLVMRLSGTR